MNSLQFSSSSRPLVPRAAVSGRVVLWSFLAGLAITIPALWVVSFLPLPDLGGAMVEARTLRLAQVYAQPGLLALKAVLIYPMLEEYIYRGLIQQLLRRYLSVGIAVLVPNLIFALTHIGAGWTNVVFALLVGLFFSWLVERSQSLLPAMICHAAINLLVVFVFRPLADSGAFALQFGRLGLSAEAWILLAVSGALFATGWRLLRSELAGTQRNLAT